MLFYSLVMLILMVTIFVPGSALQEWVLLHLLLLLLHHLLLLGNQHLGIGLAAERSSLAAT
jgi:hypothetical protein